MSETKSTQIPMPEKSGAWSWLKDHTVHIMVLVNGILLTWAVFWTVSLFIGQMLQEDYMQAGANARQEIKERFADFESTMSDFTQYFEISQNNGVAFAPKPGQVNIRSFNSVLWIPLGSPETSVDLKADTSQALPTKPKARIDINQVRQILSEAGKHQDSFIFYGDMSNSVIDKRTTAQVRSFIVVSPVKSGGRISGYLAGSSSLDRVLNSEQILSNKYVSKSVFWDGDTKTILFYMQETNENGQFVPTNSFQYDFTTDLQGSHIKTQVFFKKSNKNILLELIPALVAGFGFIVTMIAWLYAANNHKKSRTLSRVNAVLATKNEELNEQIRERERLFQTLRKSERENRAIINGISDIIFEISPNGEILFLNEAWVKITGFDLDTSLGRNLFDLILPSDQEEQRRNVAALAKGHKPAYRILTKLRTIEGTYRSVELVVSMLRQDESRNLRVVGSFTDIEERERAEAALYEAEKKYKTIWENAAGGIYQLTQQGKFISANPALARIFGYESPDHLISLVTNAHEQLFVNPQERYAFLKENSDALHEAMFHESQAYRATGEKIWVRENFRAVKDNMGNVLYYEGSIEDITERKEAEVALSEAKVQSDMASRAKSEFLANISHELRTPLNSIIGFSEIIRNQVFGPIEPASYTEYAANIHDSGKNLLSIINQILDISRIDAGERELNESLVDIRKICTTCLDLTRPKINHAGLTIIDTVPDNLPKLVAEEVAVKQMLLNLLSNAAKFTPHGGRITISGEIESSGKLRISVTDTGVGLSEEDIEKAASPFGLVDGRLDKGTGGAGLGLSLVHSLLRLHGGKLEILSQKGIGTTATLIFPADRVQA